MSLLLAQCAQSWFFSSLLQTKCRKDRKGWLLYHLHPAPSVRPSAIQLLRVVRLCVYLMDMKDHLAHGPFGKLTYWSSSKETLILFVFLPFSLGRPARNLGGFFYPWTDPPSIAVSVDSAVDLAPKTNGGESGAKRKACCAKCLHGDVV